MKLPATHLNEGISTTKPLPEGSNTDPIDSKRLKPLADRDSSTPLVIALLGTDVEYQVDQTQSTRFKVSVLDQNKGKTYSEVELDTKTLFLTIVADIKVLLVDFDEELRDDNDDDVFEAGEEMDEDIQEPETEKTQTHHST
ncbi:hypothetical protein Tco_1580330 [Tanacetum coccineum]